MEDLSVAMSVDFATTFSSRYKLGELALRIWAMCFRLARIVVERSDIPAPRPKPYPSTSIRDSSTELLQAKQFEDHSWWRPDEARR